MDYVRTWQSVHPTIRKAYSILIGKGWRITSIVRPGAVTHATGRAIDFTPRLYAAKWATLDRARRLYKQLARYLGPDFMIAGEDDHMHIGVDPPFGYGYDGVGGTVTPRMP